VAGPVGPTPRSLRLGDLISAGALRLPTEVEATYKGRRLSALIESERAVVFGGRSYPSLSTAAGMARRSVLGPSEDGKSPPTNGWTFWRVKDLDGRLQTLEAVRNRLWQRGGPRSRSTARRPNR
jgi:hypothetical protein